MNYAEAAYFEGNACQHVAEWEEWKRRRAIDNRNRMAYLERRRAYPA